MAINLGAVKQNKAIFIGGGVVAVGGALYYVKRKKAATDAASTVTATTADDTTTTDPDAIDPSTGLPYDNDASDAYSAAYDAATEGSPYSSLSGLTWDPSTGQWETATPTSTDTATPTTNAAWGTAANAYLAGLGDNPITAAAAIGKYLSGQGGALTQDELSIIQSAIGALGYPPVPVASPTLAPPTGQTNAGTSITGGVGPAFHAAYQQAVGIMNNPAAPAKQKAGAGAVLSRFVNDTEVKHLTIAQALANARALASQYSAQGNAQAVEGANQVIAALTPLTGKSISN